MRTLSALVAGELSDVDTVGTVHAPPGVRRRPAHPWSQGRIVAAILDWHAERGRAPRSYEWAPSTGRAAGLLPTGPSLWELEHPRWPSTGTVAARFGSWCNGLRAVGMPITQIAMALGLGRSTVHGYLHGGSCSSCGGPMVRGAACVACTPRIPPAAAREDVLRALVAWTAERGRPPAQHDWGWSAGPGSAWARESPRWPSAATVSTHFGTWNRALGEAGLSLTRRAEWRAEEVVAAIQAWAAEHGGVPPRYADFRAAQDRDRWPDPKTAATVFGSWRQALGAAGFTPRRSGPAAVRA